MPVKTISILILLFYFHVSVGQRTEVEDDIGFSCYYGGGPTEAVQKVQVFLIKKRFNRIVKLMGSGDNAEIFLAALVSLELNRKGLISLNNEQMNKAANILNSDKKIALGAGCSFYDVISMKELFARRGDITYQFNVDFEYWLERCLQN